MGRITYSAVVLDEESRSKLLSHLAGNIPEGWEKVAHHMTIKMGDLKDYPEWRSELGEEQTLKVTKIGYNDKAMAVAVEGFPSKNPVPHVTVAVNRNEGGKPYHSNTITNWQPVQFGLELTGKVIEVPW